jgi:DNA-binding transcriptional LysR family regulator
MELRYLLCFATVAEHLSFTRAAESLSVAQPAVSQQIKTLEEELEVKLLVRTKRSVKLTTAGHAFLREAKDILNRVEQSRMVARRAARGETATLSIGCFSAASSLFLPELIQAYRAKYPAVRIHLHEQLPDEQFAALEFGHIDVGFTRPLPKTKAGRFVQERVYQDCVMAVLSDRHALAGSQKLQLKRLADEDWVLLTRGTPPEIANGYALLCKNAGFSPRIINATTPEAALMMVAAGMGVSLAPSCYRSSPQPGLKFIPIEPDAPLLYLVAARPKGEPSPTVAAFLDMLHQQLSRIRRKYAYLRRRP